MIKTKNILLVIDVQPTFYDKDRRYIDILRFINKCIENSEYDEVIGTIFVNSPVSPFVKYVRWGECMYDAEEIDYKPDRTIIKHRYGLDNYDTLQKRNRKYTIIGYNTEACILKVALDLFDRGYDFQILTEYCYSSNGEDTHILGLDTLKRLMPLALNNMEG